MALTPAERKLLEAIARGLATRPGVDIVDALHAMHQEDVQSRDRCSVVGYPNGERRTCELDARIVHEYHQDGSTRWIGYYRSPDTAWLVTRDTGLTSVNGIDAFVDELREPPVVKSPDQIRTILLAFAAHVRRNTP